MAAADARRQRLLSKLLALSLLDAARLAAPDATVVPLGASPNPQRLSVLYLVAHDVRADVRGEHLGALAANGTVFDLAYTQVPYCAPSRVSFLTGRRPAVTRMHNFHKAPAGTLNMTALPEMFRDAGYRTASVGVTASRHRRLNECSRCWSEGADAVSEHPTRQVGYDALVAAAGAKLLRRWAAAAGPPFFLMAGFAGSHEPWTPARACLDATREAAARERSGGLPASLPPPQDTSPLDLLRKMRLLPVERARAEGELSAHAAAPTGPLVLPRLAGTHLASQRHAYLATLCELDRAVGVLLGALAQTGQRERTLVVFHADHGLSLGEFGSTGKGKLLEVDTRVPLLIAHPPARAGHARGGAADAWARGRVEARAIVQLLDVGPTLCELAAVRCARAGQPSLDGLSLVPLLQREPRRRGGAAAATAPGVCARWGVALSTQAKCPGGTLELADSCQRVPNAAIGVVGTSVRVRGWRYTLWSGWAPNFSAPLAALGALAAGERPPGSEVVVDTWAHEQIRRVRRARHAPTGLGQPARPWGRWGLADLAAESAEPSVLALQPRLARALRALALDSWTRPAEPMHQMVMRACAGELGDALRQAGAMPVKVSEGTRRVTQQQPMPP